MKQKMLGILLTGLLVFSIGAETILNLPLDGKKKLEGWNRDADKIAHFVPVENGGEALEIRLDQPEENPVYGISRSIDAAKIAGKRVTLSADVKRETKVYQKWQGGKLMLSVKHADGKYDYYGFYMEPGNFGWQKFSKSFDIPQDIVSASLLLGLQGATGVIQYRNLRIEGGDAVLDLAPAANMGYADPVANDGKGGWSDQGPENDGANFRWKQSSFGNVPFRLTDPARNGGKSVMTFANKRFPRGLQTAGIDLSTGEAKAKYLYLLHTLTFPDSYAPVGEIELVGTKNSQTLPIVDKRDIANWWMPSKMPNAFPVALWQNNGNQVGAYLSKFELNDLGMIRKVIFRKAPGSNANWIVIAATLSEHKYDLPETETVAIVPGADWKVLPLPQKGGVIAGSALDVSFLNDGKPTGTYGRVIINKDGHFAFEKQPDKPVRFLASAEAAASFRGFWTAKPQFDTREKIREYVRQLRMAGYNMIRIHFLDELLLMKAENDLDFNPKILDSFDYLVAECGKNGVYLNIDAMTSRLGYAKGERWGWKDHPETPGNFKFEIYSSERVRNHWKEGVRKLFTHVNPYTGKKMTEDPTIATVVGFNEQEFGLASGFCKDYSQLLPQWRAFLEKKYKTIPALAAAWGKTAPVPDSFDRVNIFQGGDVPRSDAYGDDINLFLEELENGIFHFYKDTLREIGYQGPVTAMNMGKGFRYAFARRDYDFVAMNGYHAHPNAFTNNAGGSGSISQASSIGDAANIVRGFTGMRRYQAPILITEHLHVFWNKYRYEQAFVTGAYSAFQDFDGLTGFGSCITVNDYSPMMPFIVGNDPIAKSQELLTALLFLRRDVAPGRHVVRLALSSDDIMKKGTANDTLSTTQGKLALVTRFAYTCDARLPLKENETILGRSGSAGIVLDPWYARIADTQTSSFNLDSCLDELRNKGALPKANRSSDANGVFETDTAEMRMETKRNYLQIDTPRLQGICAEAGSKAELADFDVREMTTRGNLVLVSIDGTKPIREAEHLLLVIATNALNDKMKFEDKDMCFLLKLGDMPILLRTGKFEVAFRNKNTSALKAYALRMDGSRLAELPLKKSGELAEFQVDTAKLPGGPAIYFELATN